MFRPSWMFRITESLTKIFLKTSFYLLIIQYANSGAPGTNVIMYLHKRSRYVTNVSKLSWSVHIVNYSLYVNDDVIDNSYLKSGYCKLATFSFISFGFNTLKSICKLSTSLFCRNKIFWSIVKSSHSFSMSQSLIKYTMELIKEHSII